MMAQMNNAKAKQRYLAWLRTVAPAVYVSAVRRATQRTRSLGGLTDDLVQQALSPGMRHSFLGDDSTSMLDEITVSAPSLDYTPPVTTNFTFDNSSLPGFDANSVAAPSAVSVDTGTSTVAPGGATTPASTSSSGIFTGILAAVTAIGAGVIASSNQSKLLTLNTQRAAQGLPPVNANGQVIGPNGLAVANPSLLAFENAITGGAGGSSLLPIIAIVGIGAYFIFGHKSST